MQTRMCEIVGQLVGVLGEHVPCDLVAVECSRRACVGLYMDEELDNLLLRDAIVEGDTQLPAQGFVRAEDSRDRHRDEGAAASVEARSRPRVSKGVARSEPFEVVAHFGLSWAEGQHERAA